MPFVERPRRRYRRPASARRAGRRSPVHPELELLPWRVQRLNQDLVTRCSSSQFARVPDFVEVRRHSGLPAAVVGVVVVDRSYRLTMMVIERRSDGHVGRPGAVRPPPSRQRWPRSGARLRPCTPAPWITLWHAGRSVRFQTPWMPLALADDDVGLSSASVPRSVRYAAPMAWIRSEERPAARSACSPSVAAEAHMVGGSGCGVVSTDRPHVMTTSGLSPRSRACVERFAARRWTLILTGLAVGSGT